MFLTTACLSNLAHFGHFKYGDIFYVNWIAGRQGSWDGTSDLATLWS